MITIVSSVVVSHTRIFSRLKPWLKGKQYVLLHRKWKGKKGKEEIKRFINCWLPKFKDMHTEEIHRDNLRTLLNWAKVRDATRNLENVTKCNKTKPKTCDTQWRTLDRQTLAYKLTQVETFEQHRMLTMECEAWFL